MPVTIKTAQFKYKNGEGEYVGVNAIGDEDAIAEIDSWLDRHPEATTTVVDGSITYNKLNTEVSGDISDLKDAVSSMTTATASDAGKALKAKTVSGGKVTAWEFGETVVVDDTLTQSGEAADAKETGDALAAKVNKPITSPDGTSGQLLRTNGDGTTQWVDQGLPTDEQTADAVETWLDNHPEATTTVQDGSITYAKLHSEVKSALSDKASAINITTEQNEFHQNLVDVQGVKFIGNAYAFTKGRYTKTKNIMPIVSTTLTYLNVDIVLNGHFITYNGTSTGYGNKQVFDEHIETCAAGEYTFVIDMSDAVPDHSRTILTIWYDSAPSTKVQVLAKYLSGSGVYTFTATGSFSRIALDVAVAGVPSYTYDNFVMWTGVYAGTNVITETDLLVPQDGYAEYSGNDLSSLVQIDTMQHDSTVNYNADTKTYVDEHTPDIMGFWSDKIYALPEDFGAVGDGVTDDTQAVSDCIAYAIQHNKQVKGFNRYNISLPVELNAQYLNVYLRELVYTGNECAVIFKTSNITFEFHTITSSAKGLVFSHTDSGTLRYARYCSTKGNTIQSDDVCIYINPSICYDSFDILFLKSTNSNCIEYNKVFQTGEWFSNENIFYSSSCSCPNGYVLYNVNASKLYNFSIEADCKYGIYNPEGCIMIGFRHREQIDGMKNRLFYGGSTNNGPLIKIDYEYDGMLGFKYISSDPLTWYSIDISAFNNYNNATTLSEWKLLAYNGIPMGVSIREADDLNDRKVIGAELFFIGGHKVYVPNGRRMHTLKLSQYDMSLFDSQNEADIVSAQNQGGWATDYVTGVQHTDFYFNASYGAIGYNNITLTQKDGYTATFYDKLGNLIFDGTNEGNGKWRFTCIMDESSKGRYTGQWDAWLYDGINEIWEIEKIS